MVTGPVIGVLALQGDVREHVQALTACGATARTVRRPEDLAQLDGLVLPGGESTTIARLSRLSGLQGPLTAALADGLPAYGSCAGMILLADRIADATAGQQSFGGLDITVRRNAFGRQTESFETDLAVAGVTGGPLRASFIRAPWVEQVGATVEVLAETVAPGSLVARVVAVRDGARLATAFHPELGGDLRVHRLFLALVAGC